MIEKAISSWYHSIKEQIKTIKNINLYGPLKAIQIYMVCDVIILEGFRVL